MEIGSIYEMAPATVNPGAGGGRQGFGLAGAEKYGKKYCHYTASGREAIALALRSVGQCRPDTAKRCLLPAYMCDTVFSPFVRMGWELHFYHVNQRLVVDGGELRSRMERVRPGLLFVHPYYGVDTWKPMRSLLLEWKRQGVCIMEDVTQSYYLEGIGAEADYVVGSLRKWYPVTDGGFVASEERLAADGLEDPEGYAGRRLEILTEKWEYLNGQGSPEEKRALKAEYLKKNREMEEELDRYDGIRELSNGAARILGETDEEAAEERRNANYGYLQEKLQGKKWFTPVMERDAGEEGKTAPLYFAVYARERDTLQGYLAARGVYAPVLWPVGKENKDDLSGDERYIYGHLLALPMDQRYGMGEMRRMVEVMEAYEEQMEGHGEQEKQEAHGEQEGHGEQERQEGHGGQEKQEGQINGKHAGGGQTVGIRADANDTVAMGHVMRCITVAGQLKRKGCRVVFFTADGYAWGLLEAAGMEAVCLHTEWNHMEGEIPRLRQELKKAGCGKLLVDSYYADAEYFHKLGDVCKLACMDDCFGEVYPVDLLVNYNAYHVRFPYQEAYGGKTRLLLGTAYVPLREEFQRRGKEADGADETERMRHVLVSSGGGDACNALAGFLSEAAGDREADAVTFHAVVGKFHPNAGLLERLAEEHPNIRLHREVRDMAGLMGQCGAAVSAAGTVLFELSAMQIPTVFFVSADNQQYDSEFFAMEDRMLFAGDIRADRKGCIAALCGGLKKILGDGELRQRMKQALRGVTDGRGAQRIAQAVVEL